MLLALSAFIFRLFQLQVVHYEEWVRQSEQNHLTKRTVEMKRGAITDRNGIELALSVETYSVFLYTKEIKSITEIANLRKKGYVRFGKRGKEIKSITEIANLLSTILPLTREEILEKVANRKGYIPIYKNLARGQAMKIKDLNISGVILEENYRREYPQNNLASNLLGFSGTDGHGLEGLELSFDKTVRGYPGITVQEDVSFGEENTSITRIIQPPTGGGNLVLTIDSFIQHILEMELAKIMEEYKPIDAMAIVMDPFTGEILGMACVPNYDLNSFASSPPEAHRNRPAVDMFEPGSCMKIFSMGAALQLGKVNNQSRFYCRGYAEIMNKHIKCHGQHGLVDIDEAIAESCNSTMVQISQILEPRQLFRTYRELGFGEPTGLELPAESQGLFSSPSRWSGLSAASLCIGQEIAVTGIQLVSAYSAIANDGWLMQPRLVKQIISHPEDNVEDFQPIKRRRVFTQQVTQRLRKMLMGVVETGTGNLAALPDYSVGGKTSTAQKANPKGGYFWDKVVCSFIGMAPALDPRIVLLVAVNEPQGDEKTLFGSKVAAPSFSIILDRILKYLKVPPDKHHPMGTIAEGAVVGSSEPKPIQTSIISDISHAVIASPSMDKNYSGNPVRLFVAGSDKVPDLLGLTLKDVASITRNFKIPAKLVGNGIAVDQSPKAGTPLFAAKSMLIKFSP